MLRETVIISNKLGLHARAAGKLIHLASRYASTISLIKTDQTTVNGKSIMGVMMLAATKGTTLEIQTEGEDEAAALEAIKSLIEQRFGEAE